MSAPTPTAVATEAHAAKATSDVVYYLGGEWALHVLRSALSVPDDGALPPVLTERQNAAVIHAADRVEALLDHLGGDGSSYEAISAEVKAQVALIAAEPGVFDLNLPEDRDALEHWLAGGATVLDPNHLDGTHHRITPDQSDTRHHWLITHTLVAHGGAIGDVAIPVDAAYPAH